MICIKYINSNNAQTVKISLNRIWQDIAAKFLPVFWVKLAEPDNWVNKQHAMLWGRQCNRTKSVVDFLREERKKIQRQRGGKRCHHEAGLLQSGRRKKLLLPHGPYRLSERHICLFSISSSGLRNQLTIQLLARNTFELAEVVVAIERDRYK